MTPDTKTREAVERLTLLAAEADKRIPRITDKLRGQLAEDLRTVLALSSEVDKLRGALKTVRAAIEDDDGLNEQSVVDTVWAGPCETVVDCIDLALNDERASLFTALQLDAGGQTGPGTHPNNNTTGDR